jgi:FkbM family methyltransferase
MVRPALQPVKYAVKSFFKLFGLEVKHIRSHGSDQPIAADTLVPQVEGVAGWPNRPLAFVLVSSNHGTMIINRNDYCVTDEGCFGVGFDIFNKSAFDSLEVQYLQVLLSNRRMSYGDGVVVIDCGANCGVHTIELARHMFGWGNVIAIEAQEMIYYALCGNVAINNCGNAKVLLAAAGSDNREILIPSPDYFQPASFGSLELQQSKSNEFIGQKIDYQKRKSIQQITIDSLKLARVDLVKVDVEGMEAEVLAGAEATVRDHRPQLHVEWRKSDANNLMGMLTKWGYKCYVVADNLIAIHESDVSGINVFAKDGILHVHR